MNLTRDDRRLLADFILQAIRGEAAYWAAEQAMLRREGVSPSLVDTTRVLTSLDDAWAFVRPSTQEELIAAGLAEAAEATLLGLAVIAEIDGDPSGRHGGLLEGLYGDYEMAN